jgi:hypothetical protein
MAEGVSWVTRPGVCGCLGAPAANKRAMGKLLFVNTNRTNGIFGVIICAALVACGIGLGIEGTYAGILLVPAGLFGGKFCLKLATTRSEIYEQGFITKSWFGSVTARYADLKGISRYAVRVNGVLNTSVYLATQSGEKAVITRESVRNHDKMTQLLDHACRALASTWLKTLERQKDVVWLVKGTTPTLRIRKDGVVYTGTNAQGLTGAEDFISLSDLQLKSGPLATVEICRGDTKIAKVNSAESNYFVGETLIAMLLENQRRPAETQPADAPKRAMTARATN